MYLSPPTLTKAEQNALLSASAEHPRDHLIFSLALGTGLRLAEIVGLNGGRRVRPRWHTAKAHAVKAGDCQGWQSWRRVPAGCVDAKAGMLLELQAAVGGKHRS